MGGVKETIEPTNDVLSWLCLLLWNKRVVTHSMHTQWLIYLKVLTLFKFIHHLSHYPSPFLKFLPRTPYPIRSYHSRNLSPLLVKSASLAKSFFPSSILLWNALPSDLKESSSLPIFSKKTLLSLSVLINLTLSPTIITYIIIILLEIRTCAIVCNKKKNLILILLLYVYD